MLPYVHGEQGGLSMAQGVLCIWGLGNLHHTAHLRQLNYQGWLVAASARCIG